MENDDGQRLTGYNQNPFVTKHETFNFKNCVNNLMTPLCVIQTNKTCKKSNKQRIFK